MGKGESQLLQFGLCLNNEGYPASLEVGKLYRVIPDDDAAAHGYIRVIDESGRRLCLYSESLSSDATAYRSRRGVVVCFTSVVIVQWFYQ